jgi:low affinity Fe/Cu permease
MTPEWQFTIGLAVTVIVALVGVLLSVLGYLAGRHLNSIDRKLNVLPTLQVQIAEVKTKQEYHTEKQDDLCERLERVEAHVSNNERIVHLENSLKNIEKERDYERSYRHWVAGALHVLALKSGVQLEPQP